MMRARTTFLVAALCLCLVGLTGCLDYREQLVLEKDGSGTLTVDFVVDLGLMADIARAFGDEPDPRSQKGPTKEEILQGLKVDGLKVEELKVDHRGQKSKVHLVLRFKTLEALSQIEGFGDERKVEFFDNGDGKVRVIYSFDTRDVIPLEELGEEPRPGEQLDPIEKKIFEITGKARERLKFLGRVELPGPILKSNGKTDPKDPTVRMWRIDKDTDPAKHANLGRGKITMKMLVDRSTVPWVTELQPLPRGETPGKGGDDGAGGPPKLPRGLGD